MKYKHILYPTDGSVEAQKALAHVKKIAKIFEAPVTILCAYKLPYSINNSFISLPNEIYDQYKLDNRNQAKKIVDEIVNELSNVNIDAETLVLEGNAKVLICEYTKKLGCDLIIMGTRGHSQLNYIGSTSTYVINNVENVAVMVVS
jgi:nucleotide-binding universal stress UspA family protein